MSGPIGNSESPKVALKSTESNADFVPRLGGTPLEFQPGSRWAYSATAAFDTLVRVVEVASGQKFNQFASERMFTPLEMKDTFFYPPESRKPRIATMCSRNSGKLQQQNNPDCPLHRQLRLERRLRDALLGRSKRKGRGRPMTSTPGSSQCPKLT